MANQAMGKTMGNTACEWVRARLPLRVSVNDDLTERDGEGDDLSPEERQSIEGHLGACPSCRQHRADLERASRALAGAAGSLLVAPDAPSLWPSLELRVQAHDARTRRPWLRAVYRVTDRGLRALADLDGERPLRSAWVRDSLGEVLEGAGLPRRGIPVRDGRRRLPGRGRNAAARSGRSPAWVTRTGVAAASLALLIGLPAIRRQHTDAQSIIRANAEPIPVTQRTPAEKLEAPAPAELANDRDIPPRELAQAEPIPVPQPPPPGREGAPTSRIATPSRLNFDLEHGTPMPPDARDAKPVY
jgi:Putative zinc-finger